MSSATFFKWRFKYGGMDVCMHASLMTRLRDLEEDHRLNKVYALAKKRNTH